MTNSAATKNDNRGRRWLVLAMQQVQRSADNVWIRLSFTGCTFATPHFNHKFFDSKSLPAAPSHVSVHRNFSHWSIPEWQFWLVLIAATAVTVTLQANVPFWFGGSDHADFYKFGRFILGELAVEDLPQGRTPGMGLFYIASGTLLFDTWKGFIALSAIFSAAMPVLTYLLVRPHSPTLALVVGLVTILSMTPYIYATMAASDHVYYFLHLLLLLFCVMYLRDPQYRSRSFILGIAILAAYVVMVRPVGALIFWLFIAVSVLVRPRDWRPILGASVLYIAIMGAWVQWDRTYGTNGGAMPGTGVFPTLTELSTLSERRFAEAYFSPAGLAHARDHDAADGFPASTKLRALLRRHLMSDPENWRQKTSLTPLSLFAAYDGSPERLLDAIFQHSNSIYFAFVMSAVRAELSEEEVSNLISSVAYEHGTSGFYGFVAGFWRHPTSLLLGAIPSIGSRTRFASYYRAKIAAHYSISSIPDPLLTPNLGPNVRNMLIILRNFIDDYPQYWETAYPEQARYKSRPDDFYRAIISGGHDDVENGRFEGFIFEVLAWYLGPLNAGQLYNGAVLEILRHYPKLAFIAYDNFLNMTVVRNFGAATGSLFSVQSLLGTSDGYFISPYQVTRDLSRGLASELIPVITTNAVWKTAAVLHSFMYDIAPLFLYMLIAALTLYMSPAVSLAARWTCLFLILVYLYEVTSIALFTPWGTPRYSGTFYLLPLIVSAIIFGQVGAGLIRKKPVSHRS
jgi:hypothetical protein